MASPSELIRMAEERRRMGIARNMQAEAPREQERIARTLPTGHASYTKLMQRHDRMRTRHLSGSGA